MNGTARLLIVMLAAGVAAFATAEAQAADVKAKIKKQRLVIESGAGNANITLRLRRGHRQQLIVDADSNGDAEFRFDRRRFTAIVLDGKLGNDILRISDKFGAFTTTERTTVLGGNGDDTLLGGAGSERFFGGPGIDTVEAGRGADAVSLGPDNDVFNWKTGHGKDTVEGQAGFDTARVVGTAVGKSLGVTRNGTRGRVARNGARAIDAAGVERLELLLFGGGDTVSIGDLTGTAFTELSVTFAPSGGFVNQLLVSATNGDDVAILTGSSSSVVVNGLAALITVVPSAVTDVLRVNMLAGDDVIDASGVAAGAFSFILDGGAGNDVVLGTAGPDTAYGGDGDDVLVGGPGIDFLDGGAGDNVVVQD